MKAALDQNQIESASDHERGPMGAATPLFVVGAPRSGTTVLTNILNAHPQILLTNESATVIQISEMIENSRIGVREGLLFGKIHTKLWADLLLSRMRDLVERFYVCVAEVEGKSISDGTDALVYYGEKHPHLKDYSSILESAFPDARYIYVVRDPRDSALSIASMSGDSYSDSLLNWKMFDDSYTEFFESVSPDMVHLVRYEEFVADYDGCVSRVLDWLGLDPDSQVTEHIERYSNVDAHTLPNVNHVLSKADNTPQPPEQDEQETPAANQFLQGSVGRWQRELPDEDLGIADSVVGEALERYGYKPWKVSSSQTPDQTKPIDSSPCSGGGSRGTDEMTVKFQCNICAKRNTVSREKIGRETSSCSRCGSTVRMRSIVHLLSLEIFGKSMTIADMPPRTELVGIGMSDWLPYADRLSNVFSYTNTFYDTEPNLDITDPDPTLFGSLDFLISSDVFEHVAPPIAVAFENARKLLKPGGVFIFSVPYSLGATAEHYPELYKYEIVGSGDSSVLTNTTRSGECQEFSDLVFHGGRGATLEMRVFGKDQLVDQFIKAGFQKPTICCEPYMEFGIEFPQQWSLPMVIRA